MPTLVLLWVWVCAYLNCAGWALSALHQLNARGYAVVLALGFAALLFWWLNRSQPGRGNFRLRKFFRRFPQTISARLFDSGGDGVHRRRAVSADQLRRAGVSAAAHFALAGGGAMALDSHVFPAHQQPLVRHRMGFRAVPRAAENPTGCCFSSTSFHFCCCRGWCSACSRGSA